MKFRFLNNITAKLILINKENQLSMNSLVSLVWTNTDCGQNLTNWNWHKWLTMWELSPTVPTSRYPMCKMHTAVQGASPGKAKKKKERKNNTSQSSLISMQQVAASQHCEFQSRTEELKFRSRLGHVRKESEKKGGGGEARDANLMPTFQQNDPREERE